MAISSASPTLPSCIGARPIRPPWYSHATEKMHSGGAHVDTELRPLSLGEILDRIFHLYRTHFLTFVGISTVAAAIDLVWKLIQTGILQIIGNHVSVKMLSLVTVGFTLPSMVVYIVASAVVMAAINRAVSAIYLGKTTGIAQAIGEVKGHWFRYVWLYVVVLLIAWSPIIIAFTGLILLAVALPMRGGGSTGALYAGIFGLSMSMLVLAPLGLWMTLRYSLSNPACVFEDLGIRASLKRSVFLSRGALFKLNIFVMLMLAGVLSMVITYAGLIPVIVVAVRTVMNHGKISLAVTMYTLLVGFVSTSLTTPFYSIGLTLFYYDARIRKEGFDVEWMMQRATPAEIPAPLPMMPPPESTLG